MTILKLGKYDWVDKEQLFVFGRAFYKRIQSFYQHKSYIDEAYLNNIG